MPPNSPSAHPYIPNSAPQTKAAMLAELGLQSTEELFSAIPPELRLDRPLDLPEPILSEFALRRHVQSILARNQSAEENLSFLGAGCYQHYVPAVCDEIIGRSEFLTAYSGRPYEDHGRYQALFEYESMLAELLDMDVVNLPTYDGDQAAATAMRMAANLTSRREILVGRTIHPHKRSKVEEYCGRSLCIRFVDFDPASGQLDFPALERAISSSTAAVYFDNPNFFGVIEAGGRAISDLAHRHGALCIVGADPISLGVLLPPSGYGADLVCGDIQSLGMHMQFGGGQAGYIASRDEERFIAEFPNRITGLLPTRVPGEYGFGEIAFARTSFIGRERGKEWVGTMANLWAINAGVYLALMGPQGMRELGEGLLARLHYARQALGCINGLRLRFPGSPHFREFLLDFSDSGKPVAEINRLLRQRGIFGGYDVGQAFPEFEHHALYCITEIHGQREIERLVAALAEVLS